MQHVLAWPQLTSRNNNGIPSLTVIILLRYSAIWLVSSCNAITSPLASSDVAAPSSPSLAPPVPTLPRSLPQIIPLWSLLPTPDLLLCQALLALGPGCRCVLHPSLRARRSLVSRICDFCVAASLLCPSKPRSVLVGVVLVRGRLGLPLSRCSRTTRTATSIATITSVAAMSTSLQLTRVGRAAPSI
jgi:hypothetical protein